MAPTSPFLTLPAELRIKILRLSLSPGLVQVIDHPGPQRACGRRRRFMKSRCQDTEIGILKDWRELVDEDNVNLCSKLKYFDCSGQTASNHEKPTSLAMSLLLLCPELHEEAVEVVYDKYVFSFDSVRVFCDFINLHNYASQRIRTLMVAHLLIPGPCRCNTFQYPNQWGPMMLANPVLPTFLELVFLQMPQLRRMRLFLDNDELLERNPWCHEMNLVQSETLHRFGEMARMIVKLAERRRKGAAMPLNHWEMCILPNWVTARPAEDEEVRSAVKNLREWVREEVCRAE
jgi:hypothetical protein